MKVTIEIDARDEHYLKCKPIKDLSYIEKMVWDAIPSLPKKGDKYTFRSSSTSFEVYSCDGVYVLLLSDAEHNRYPHAVPMADFYKDWTEA